MFGGGPIGGLFAPVGDDTAQARLLSECRRRGVAVLAGTAVPDSVFDELAHEGLLPASTAGTR